MGNIIEVEGIKYRKVDRKAEVGDLITYNYNGSFSNSPRRVIEITMHAAEFTPYVDADDDETIGYAHDAYDVLERIEVEDKPLTTSDMLANLALRVSLLEKEEVRGHSFVDLDGTVTVSLTEDDIKSYKRILETPDLNGKQLRIYTATDVFGAMNTHITVGIDEATGIMYVLGMKTEVSE